MTTKQVFSLRREGRLLDALDMGRQLYQHFPSDEWVRRALLWCIIDACKECIKCDYTDDLKSLLSELETISIPNDKLLHEQIEKVKSLTQPHANLAYQAFQASKASNYQEALSLYREALQLSPTDGKLKEQFHWTIYNQLKVFMKLEKPPLFKIKQLLTEYLNSSDRQASQLHSLFLRVAIKIGAQIDNPNQFDIPQFCLIWGLDNLADDDYLPNEYKEKTYPSLAEKLLLKATKQAIATSNVKFLEQALKILPKAIENSNDPIWLNWSLAKIHGTLKQTELAITTLLPILKVKINEYWAWEFLGDLHLPQDKQIALACYCKALSLEPQEIYINNLKQKFHELQSQLSITVSADLKEFYEKNKGAAEEMLLSNVPWLTAYIGDVFKIPSNGKLKRNLYILGEENNKEPTVQPLSAKKPELKNLAEGTKVRIQCEKRAESHHYEIYKIVPHDSSRESEPPFHEVAEQMAVVAHINQAKQLAYVTVRRGVCNPPILSRSYS